MKKIIVLIVLALLFAVANKVEAAYSNPVPPITGHPPGCYITSSVGWNWAPDRYGGAWTMKHPGAGCGIRVKFWRWDGSISTRQNLVPNSTKCFPEGCLTNWTYLGNDWSSVQANRYALSRAATFDYLIP